MNYIKKRGDWYHYVRRIPKALMEIDNRSHIQLKLSTKCPDTAARRCVILNEYVEAYWDELFENGPDDGLLRFRKVTRLAELHGFQYRPAAAILDEGLGSVIARYEAVAATQNDPDVAASILGAAGEASSVLRYSNCFDIFWSHARPQVLGKSPDQIRKWRAPRIRAIKTFISIVGDKLVNDTARNDILAVRNWWMDRVEKDGIRHDTVNKAMAHFKGILTTLNDYEDGIDLDVPTLFTGTCLSYQEPESPPPFSTSFVQDTLLNQSQLSGMSEDGRLLICALADTGARPREIITRRKDDIFLDAEVPYIKIRPYSGMQLKTPQSKRDIPLVGAALHAFQKRPEGFTKYTDRVDSFTSAVNKFLRENEFLETSDHSLYSLRHSFEDRLIAQEVGDRMACELMGHKFVARAKYGAGPTLEHKHRVLLEGAFRVVD
jgi:integrase